MARIFAITNQKGGVGKTTTCVNLAASIAAANRRVLLVDLDPQGNATMGSGVDKRALRETVYELLIGAAGIRAFGKPESILYDVKYILPRDAVDGRL